MTPSAIAHCPISQLFLGSGTMPWRRTLASGVRLGVGSDVGASETFSIPEVLNACYKAHLSEPFPDRVALHAAELLHLGTLEGAQTLSLEHRIGNLDPGKEADFVVLAAKPGSLLGRRRQQIRDLPPPQSSFQRLFLLLLGLGSLSVRRVWVRGREVSGRG